MNKKFGLLIGIIILLVVVVIGYKFFFNAGPKTPLHYAREQSDLDLPSNIKLLEFHNQWNEFNGDGGRKIIFELPDQLIGKLKAECISKGYKKLPIIENGYMPVYINTSDTGFYKLKLLSDDGSDFQLSIIDFTKEKMYFLVSIQ